MIFKFLFNKNKKNTTIIKLHCPKTYFHPHVCIWPQNNQFVYFFEKGISNNYHYLLGCQFDILIISENHMF